MLTTNSILVCVLYNKLWVGHITPNKDGYYVKWDGLDPDSLVTSNTLESIENNFLEFRKEYQGAILNSEQELLAYKLKLGDLK